MGQLVSPKVFLVGYTGVDYDGLEAYLIETNQKEFMEDWYEALSLGVSPGEALCSFFSKICYKSLTLGKNTNIKKTRSIPDNIRATFNTAHLSVFEHFQLNFIVTNCSRILTHEQVRHRAGWAYSQTSGRYCRLDSIDLVWDSILDPVKELVLKQLQDTELTVYRMECKLGLRKPNPAHPNSDVNDYIHILPHTLTKEQREEYKWVPDDSFDFEKRKKLTSAIRRIAPNGQSNEIGMSCNVRSLRHVVQLRTARHAEREIREVYNQIYTIIQQKFPLMFYGAKENVYDGLIEVSGMKMNPYDIELGDLAALKYYTVSELQEAIDRQKDKQE